MNKKLLALIVVLFAVAIVFANREIISTETSNVSNTPLPAPETKNVSEKDIIDYDEFSLGVAEIKIGNISNIELIPNFKEELPANEIAKNNNCRNIVNTGFYTEDRKPIGLFVNERGVLSSYQKNNTLNGVLSISEEGTVISYGEPLSPRLAVQTGPVIILDGEVIDLNLQRDFYARRIVAATDVDRKLYFFAVYNPKSSIQGPNLADLGEVVKDYSERNDIELERAINLDGGAASAFFSDNITLEELVPVGSVFCIN